MKTTLEPEVIYEVFSRLNLPVLRIDRFDRGNYAELRVELPSTPYLGVDDLQQLVNRLRVLEKEENLHLQVVHIDMHHHTMRINLSILDERGGPP